MFGSAKIKSFINGLLGTFLCDASNWLGILRSCFDSVLFSFGTLSILIGLLLLHLFFFLILFTDHFGFDSLQLIRSFLLNFVLKAVQSVPNRVVQILMCLVLCDIKSVNWELLPSFIFKSEEWNNLEYQLLAKFNFLCLQLLDCNIAVKACLPLRFGLL